jgi:adenosylcobinamide kinase/adenosylcobinamide-phosphate guanylyltransferase
MDERIRRHREERGSDFLTLEEPIEIGKSLQALKEEPSIIVVDCLTLWSSNLLKTYGQDSPEGREQIGLFLSVLDKQTCPVVLIGNEVGWGIVPDNPLARAFRDMIGRLHQEIARIADQVILMVAGIPMIVRAEK